MWLFPRFFLIQEGHENRGILLTNKLETIYGIP